MKVVRVLLAACFIILVTGSFGWASDRVDLDKAGPVSKVQTSDLPGVEQILLPSTAALAEKSARVNYNAYLRVFIVELTSIKYHDANGVPYDFAFRDFGLDTLLSLPYLGTFQTTKTWHPSDSVLENNVMVIAVLFNAENCGTGYSDPPYGLPFTIHFADAAAQATPGHPGYDTAFGTYTHTVFLEEATSET
jgi:hypothetical protein